MKLGMPQLKNIQHPTSNPQYPIADTAAERRVETWMLDVGCWMLDVPRWLRILGFLATWCLTCLPSAGALIPAHLRCEYSVDPLGIDVLNPRLFWTVESKER